MIEIIILSIVQGITEFLPISSSAHLILISKYLSFNSENLTIDISLHLGSLIAVIFFFKTEVLNFVQNKNLFIKIIIGSFPTLIIGFLIVKLDLITQLRNIYIISFTSIIFSFLLYYSDKIKSKKKIEKNFSFKDSLIIGVMQTISLIPGVSRSGITLTGARFLSFDRVDSGKISFLFSIPILASVSFYGFIELLKLKNFEITIQNYWAIILSFVFSLLTLKFFIKFLKKFSLIFFVIYRIILGTILLIYVYNS